MGSNLVQSDPKNFAPRLGIAWSPTANWTVRAGAGIFFSQDTGNPVFDMARNLAGRVNNTANTNTHNLTFENPFAAAQASVASPCLRTSASLPPFCWATNYNRRTPYMEQYELNIQRQLGNNTALEIGYLGSQGHRLERIQYFNQPTPGPGSTASREPWPEFGFVQEVIGLVSSNYNSLAAKLTRRMSNGFTFLLGYTFSKSIDNGSGERIIGTDNIDAQNEYCMSCERGLVELRPETALCGFDALPIAIRKRPRLHESRVGRRPRRRVGSRNDLEYGLRFPGRHLRRQGSIQHRCGPGPAERGARRSPGSSAIPLPKNGSMCRPLLCNRNIVSETWDGTW